MDWLVKRDNQPFGNSIVFHGTESECRTEAHALNKRYQTTQYYVEPFRGTVKLGRFPNE